MREVISLNWLPFALMNKNENSTLSRLAFRLAPKLNACMIGFTYQGTPISSAKAGSGGPDMEISFTPGLQHPQVPCPGSLSPDCAERRRNHAARSRSLLLVVDQDIRTEGLHQLEARGACRDSHRRAQMFRQLDGEGADTAGARLDEDLLPGLQLGHLDECLPSGQANQRNGSRFFHAECCRLDRHIAFVHGDEFCEGPNPVLIRSRIDLVAGFEAPHLRAHLDHKVVSHVVAENKRETDTAGRS